MKPQINHVQINHAFEIWNDKNLEKNWTKVVIKWNFELTCPTCSIICDIYKIRWTFFILIHCTKVVVRWRWFLKIHRPKWYSILFIYVHHVDVKFLTWIQLNRAKKTNWCLFRKYISMTSSTLSKYSNIRVNLWKITKIVVELQDAPCLYFCQW